MLTDPKYINYHISLETHIKPNGIKESENPLLLQACPLSVPLGWTEISDSFFFKLNIAQDIYITFLK